ncbi:hypothetical protein AUEXF2481DRAFT_319085 [Aureobasidium subglaciale EXF-2481]|uniref:Uncharacterized protein n=1 Tax=Aureobasidium subglaciale (strain EXF-2481) TaxID=1043005 RepID=A0A074YD13_AURSE|nr:uncharacterized protein AUEXF2481DRAFT_319085 [Aureobasidium subglaciale EXF-2481]KEQ93944.1 hypothetical protein AUEXF2481DRAFT_319085 [Aureobasidium subglaciale EXF-2481]
MASRASSTAMWLPSDLLALCHSITNPTSENSTDSTSRPDHRCGQDGSLSPLRPRHQSHKESAQKLPFPLLQLPLDILALHLPTHLPYDALISLRLSNRDLFKAISIIKRSSWDTLTECERGAILTAAGEKEELSTRRCCTVCRSWYPLALFAWGPNSGTAQGGDQGCEGGLFENRVCRWHRTRFERTLSSLTTDKNRVKPGWAVEEACMHCGGVLAWNRCDCLFACQTCWKRDVWCYTHIDMAVNSGA